MSFINTLVVLEQRSEIAHQVLYLLRFRVVPDSQLRSIENLLAPRYIVDRLTSELRVGHGYQRVLERTNACRSKANLLNCAGRFSNSAEISYANRLLCVKRDCPEHVFHWLLQSQCDRNTTNAEASQ